MGMFIREAGWGIWPVMFFGLLGLVVATRHAIAPSRERMPLIIGLALATVLMGVLGAVTGVQVSASGYAVAEMSSRLFLVGLRESLNNMVGALLFATVHTLIGTYGTHKLVRREMAEQTAAA